MGRRGPIKAPNPFGEGSRDGGMSQPPAAPAPATTHVPVTAVVVLGQPRTELRRAYGHVLTERGWVKEGTENPWQT